ncbi:SufBD protein [Oscillibacter sp. MSJ-2]|uniref:SufBD protein n=1 Tax=Dysosmobacter acutus TaxID=2841504 RepID=A0ABS6F8A6_9FIRM|nr:SufBD protein [Dysosmobacter acutus]MBU5625822.1 SufBD protein [Dysosmobacter acutus]
MIDSEIGVHVSLLTGKDAGAAYASLLALEAESRESDAAFGWFDEFAAMLTHRSGFVRMRGLRLVAANARWDREGKVDRALGDYFACMEDPKPIVARQCIQHLWLIGEARPDLRPEMVRALRQAEPSRYAQSMAPLVEADRREALERLLGR